jgi:uncharacterized protein
MSALKAKLLEDIKTAMKSGDKNRLATLRLMSSDIKQIEVDTRTVLDDAAVLSIFEKMLKRRKDSIEQFTAANRHDLADIEKSEVAVIQAYLPEPLSAAELDAAIADAIAEAGATNAKDMGKVMTVLKAKVAGRADMTALSGKVKAKLG